MLTKDDLKQIGDLMDERMDKRFGEQKTYIDKRFAEQDKRFDQKLDLKLKKAFRGVARKKDLIAMENRFIKKVNTVLDHSDSRLLTHEKRITCIETHLQLPVVSL